MGSRDKFYGRESASHGFDDVGMAQPAGTISGIGPGSGIYATKLQLTVNDTSALRKGQAINITALDAEHNGLTRILRIVSSTVMIVNITYNVAKVDAVGVWDCKGGASSWDAFMPIGADLTAANVALTFWDDNQQGSNEVAVNYTKDVKYAFPAGIKTILISTAGNVRMFRSASLRPNGATAQ